MFRNAAIFGFILCLCSATALAQPKPRKHGKEATAAGLDVKVLESLDFFMQRQSNRQVSGVVALIGRHGKIGYFEAFGHRDIEAGKPMTEDTLFRIASMTKPIVAVTAMTLWEEGKFKLDDPISNHLPEWKDVKVKKGDELFPAKTAITPRHLLTDSSGVATSGDYEDGVKLNFQMTSSQFSKALAKQPLHFQPGTEYLHGLSTGVLGRYIEAIEGKPLDRVMQERVFGKLGMTSTGFWVKKAADRDRIAQVYTRNRNRELRPVRLMGPGSLMIKPVRMGGGPGLVSTAGDFAKFAQMLLNKGELNGKRVLKRETVDLMLQNHLPKPIGKEHGLGAPIDDGCYQHGGAFGTYFLIDPKIDCVQVFMSQRLRYQTRTKQIFLGHAKHALVGVKQEKNADKDE